MGSHEVAGLSDTKTVLWSNGFNSGCFQLHMSQNVAKSMPMQSGSPGPASPVVIPCRLSAWPSKLEPFTDHLSTDGRQTGPWMKPQ